MELKDTSKEGIGKFALELIKKYGKDVVFSLISALVQHIWEKDPKEDGGVTTQGDQDGGVWPNCKSGYSRDDINKKCVKDPLP